MDYHTRRTLQAQYDACSWLSALTERSDVPDTDHGDGNPAWTSEMIWRSIQQENLRAQNACAHHHELCCSAERMHAAHQADKMYWTDYYNTLQRFQFSPRDAVGHRDRIAQTFSQDE